MAARLHGPGSNEYWEPSDRFYKRIRPEDWNKAEGRPNSGAFRAPEMSVNWAALSSVDHTIEESPDHGVVVLTAKVCIDEEQVIKYTPVKDDPKLPDNIAHCDVVGLKGKSRGRQLAKKSVLCRIPNSL